MKVFIIIFSAIIFLGLLGLVTYQILSNDPTEKGSVDTLLETERMEEASQMIQRLVISVAVAAVIGGLFILFVLPKASETLANLVYDQNSQPLDPPELIDQGRSLKMQEKFEEAIEKFRLILDENAENREAWIEIAGIQEVEFEDAELALATLREGWQSSEWEMEDDINFIHRIATIENDHFKREIVAKELYESIIERYEENDYQVNRAKKAIADLS